MGETLRILLVSTQESVREEVEQALAGLPGDFRLYWVTRPDLAMVRASDLAPHLIIVDDALGDVDPAELIGQLAASLPTSALLSLVQQDALETARRAILLGARGFVAKPIVAEELLGAVRQTVARREMPVGATEAGSTLGRVVVFCGPKGGTGRTTLAINTAISLCQIPGNSVVLVDADYAAPAIDVALNLTGQRDITDLLPKMTHLDSDLVAGVLATHESGLHVLLAPPPATLDRPLSLPQVQQVLVWLRRMFPWVIVDLGLPLDETAFAFLDGADLICMSVNPEMIGLRNTRFMLDQLLAQGYPSDRIWPILNRAGLAGGLSLLELEGWLGTKIRYQIPNDQTLATDTVNRGVPMALSYRRSPVARACRGLARELMAALPISGRGRPAGPCRATNRTPAFPGVVAETCFRLDIGHPPHRSAGRAGTAQGHGPAFERERASLRPASRGNRRAQHHVRPDRAIPAYASAFFRRRGIVRRTDRKRAGCRHSADCDGPGRCGGADVNGHGDADRRANSDGDRNAAADSDCDAHPLADARAITDTGSHGNGYTRADIHPACCQAHRDQSHAAAAQTVADAGDPQRAEPARTASQ